MRRVQYSFNPEISSIKELLGFLNNIPNINFGGCGISALVIHDYFTSVGIKSKIIYSYKYFNQDEYEDNLKRIAYKEHVHSCGHAIVKVGKLYYDSRGVKTEIEREHFHFMTRKQAVLSIKHSKWCDMFDKEIYLPIIEKKIGYKLLVD